MSGLFDYQAATRLANSDVPFDALIMAAVLRADSTNLAVLREAFPDQYIETSQRRDAPGGKLADEIAKPKGCRNCGASYDDCTAKLRSEGTERPCCGACKISVTHGQNEWERLHGSKLTTEV